MKISVSLLLFINTCFNSISQTSTVIIYTDFMPKEFDKSNPVIRQSGILMEAIYRYKKNEKNKDSTLVVTNYFDSLGNNLERDEYSPKNREPREITNYYYTNNLLVRKEQQRFGSINSLIVNTYYYDSAGNKTIEKTYSVNPDNSYLLQEIRKWEYDENNRISKLFDKLYDNEMYLYNSFHYDYDSDTINLVKTYDPDGKWLYSYIHEFDMSLNKKSIYLNNQTGKKLETECFYDHNKQLIKEIYHSAIPFPKNHSRNVYEYYENGLIYRQTLQLEDGTNIYFRHYYLSDLN